MLNLKKNKPFQNYLFFKSNLVIFNIFFVDLKIDIPVSISSFLYKNKLFLKKDTNICFFQNKKLIILKRKTTIFIIIDEKNKIKFKKLYKQLFFLKLKGLLQKFKLILSLNGIGFKAFLKNQNLILKLGYSHTIVIQIPSTIKILIQNNKLIFYSIDFIFLTQFIHFIKQYKPVEPYKGKGLILNFEQILRKEGKKSKK